MKPVRRSNPSNLVLTELVFSADMIFGFVPDAYSIDESGQQVIFNVTLVMGTLVRDVEIEFFTEDGSALGNSCAP